MIKKIISTIFLCMGIYPVMQGMQFFAQSECPAEGMVRIFAQQPYVDVKQEIAFKIPVIKKLQDERKPCVLPYAQTQEDINCAVNYVLIPTFPNQEQAFVDTLTTLDLETLARRTQMIAAAWRQQTVPQAFALAWSQHLHSKNPIGRGHLQDLNLNDEMINSIMILQNQDALAQRAEAAKKDSDDDKSESLKTVSHTLHSYIPVWKLIPGTSKIITLVSIAGFCTGFWMYFKSVNQR